MRCGSIRPIRLFTSTLNHAIQDWSGSHFKMTFHLLDMSNKSFGGGSCNSGKLVSGSQASPALRVVDEMSEAMTRPRWNHGATVTAQVALASTKADKPLAELAEQAHTHPTQITERKQ